MAWLGVNSKNQRLEAKETRTVKELGQGGTAKDNQGQG